jgi:hypothetical protein
LPFLIWIKARFIFPAPGRHRIMIEKARPAVYARREPTNVAFRAKAAYGRKKMTGASSGTLNGFASFRSGLYLERRLDFRESVLAGPELWPGLTDGGKRAAGAAFDRCSRNSVKGEAGDADSAPWNHGCLPPAHFTLVP